MRRPTCPTLTERLRGVELRGATVRGATPGSTDCAHTVAVLAGGRNSSRPSWRDPGDELRVVADQWGIPTTRETWRAGAVARGGLSGSRMVLTGQLCGTAPGRTGPASALAAGSRRAALERSRRRSGPRQPCARDFRCCPSTAWLRWGRIPCVRGRRQLTTTCRILILSRSARGTANRDSDSRM